MMCHHSLSCHAVLKGTVVNEAQYLINTAHQVSGDTAVSQEDDTDLLSKSGFSEQTLQSVNSQRIIDHVKRKCANEDACSPCSPEHM